MIIINPETVPDVTICPRYPKSDIENSREIAGRAVNSPIRFIVPFKIFLGIIRPDINENEIDTIKVTQTALVGDFTIEPMASIIEDRYRDKNIDVMIMPSMLPEKRSRAWVIHKINTTTSDICNIRKIMLESIFPKQ